MAMHLEDDFKLVVKKFQERPDLFFKEVLGIESLEGFQKDFIMEIAQYDRVAAKASHSMGKTWSLARVVLWFLMCFKPSKIITTAPTHRQVVKLLWGEIASAHRRSKFPLGGRLLTNELKIIEGEWYALGFSPKKEAGTDQEQSGSSFQGFHADHVMVVFDEATGIQPDMYKMAEGLMTSGKVVKWVCIANPTTRASSFFPLFSNAAWKKTSLPCFLSPNLIENGFKTLDDIELELDRLKILSESERLHAIQQYSKPVPHLISAQWVISKALDWGIDHPLFLSKALAEFPSDADNVMVNYSSVQAAYLRDYEIKADDERFIGVDVARYGEDLTVITEMIGYKVTKIKAMAKRDLMHITGEVMNVIHNKKSIPTTVLVDATGLGAGVVDALIENQEKLGEHTTIEEIHFGAACKEPEDKEKYLNLKAKIFTELSSDMKNFLDLPDESIYAEELPTIQYKFTSRGLTQVESKDDYKKRTKRKSPDYSDSLALANFGRHINMKVGSFQKQKSSKPLNKREPKPIESNDGIGRIKKRIKAREY